MYFETKQNETSETHKITVEVLHTLVVLFSDLVWLEFAGIWHHVKKIFFPVLPRS